METLKNLDKAISFDSVGSQEFNSHKLIMDLPTPICFANSICPI